MPDRLVCWVGSANLTTSGFGGNTELVHEYSDDGTTAAWFARAWNSCEYPTLEWLDEYEQRTRAGPKTIAIGNRRRWEPGSEIRGVPSYD